MVRWTDARFAVADRSQGDALGWANPRPFGAESGRRNTLPSPLSPLPSPPTPSSLAPRPSPLGFTLIELLIVISIMLILVALTATMMRPDVEGRRVREAARSINVYLASARNRATETGRPCGVIFRQFGATSCAMNADQCEVPPSYCGESEQSVARLQVQMLGTPSVETLVATLDAGPPPGLVRTGDLVQFNCQGPLYAITNPADDPPATPEFVTVPILTLTPHGNQNLLVPWPDAPSVSQSVPYRIFRAPMKGFAQPLQLPAATVVDLGASGVGINFVGAADFTVLFSPNGAVECVYLDATRQSVVDPIYLLVGKRERVENTTYNANAPESELTNYQDLGNRWVTINPQTGVVQTEPVAAITNWKATTNYYAGNYVTYDGETYQCIQDNTGQIPETSPLYWQKAEAIIAARLLAGEALGMGGK